MIQAFANALSERGYENLTAVQEAVIDPALRTADLLVSAQTGSGKTVGFGLAIGPTLMGDDEILGPAAAPLALIVAPTRELAFQVMRELDWLYAKAGARVTSCVGGMDMRDERRALDRGAHIVVGTPGRLRDHIQRGSLDMSRLRAVVLDEADEMLDLGFREDLEFMLSEAPEDRRTLLFSATVPPMIARLARQYQRDAVRVTTLTGDSQHADISYQLVRVAQQDAENAIINMLRYHDAQNALVFANTRAMVSRLTARLTNRGFSVVALSGELSQSERTHALQAMRDGRAQVCVATDVAARGIDLPKLELVIHAELPSNAEGLLHRSGRTGRAGNKGTSALIVPPKITKKAERLLKFAKIDARWITPPSVEDVLRRDEERLLANPVWNAETTPDQDAFAARLLELHGPRKIAAAYLALHQARLSAPEDLADPDIRPERSERKPFGPSVWFALSVGRNDRAEPRWLLPLLCRAGNLDKEEIGAIRIRQTESFVELREASVPGFLSAIGDSKTLEHGVTVQQLAKAPKFVGGPKETVLTQRPPRATEKSSDAGFKPSEGCASTAKPKRKDKMAQALADGTVTALRKPKNRGGAKPAPAGTTPSKNRSSGKPKVRTAWSTKEKPTGKNGSKAVDTKEKRFRSPPSDARKPESQTDTGPAATDKRASDTSKRFSPPGTAGKRRKPKAPGARSGTARMRKDTAGKEPPRRG